LVKEGVERLMVSMTEHQTMGIYEKTKQALSELLTHTTLTEEHILVLGVSTSEVQGAKIGTAGTEEVASSIFIAIEEARKKHGFHVAYQSCEHINRALVVERSTAKQFHLEEVSVVPVAKAGGSMASYVYKQFAQPVMVEHIKADAGLDIGDTFIGMHLKHVAVPVRGTIKEIGNAHLTMAITRPKLIGGIRASYIVENK
jgi:uncharacterized protein (TIGR01440 family)